MGADGLEPKWKKIEIIMKPIGGLITALVIGVIGWMVNGSISEQQTRDADYRLYTELISQRESAESALRKDMFTQVISEFISPVSESVESKLLQLELLTYNFHESLNLQPLFKHQWRLMDRKRIKDSTEEDSVITRSLIKRLRKAATENIARQMGGLEQYGGIRYLPVSWEGEDRLIMTGTDEDHADAYCIYDVGEKYYDNSDMQFTMTVEGITRDYRVSILEVNVCTEELLVELEISNPLVNETEPHRAPFHVSYYDFPVIDNMRLSKNQRAALVLQDFQPDDSSAEIALICFPGRYASLKERNYIQDVFDELVRVNERNSDPDITN